MKKLGYFLLLLVILSACTSGAGQKSAGDLSALGVDQTTAEGSVASDIQPSSASVPAMDPSVAPSSTFAVSQKGEALTPFQLQLEQGINQRKAAGLPVPSVKFDYQATSNDALLQISGIATTSTNPTRVVSKTVIQFDGPEQAGYTEWPPLVTKDNLPPEVQATVKEEDYTEAYRKFLEEKIPGIWDKYEFGHEPRVYTFVETIETTYPSQNLLETNPMAAQAVTSTEQLLMGFTYTGPNISYLLEQKLETPEICINLPWPLPDFCASPIEIFYVKAGFAVDWALGLRLPAEATLIGPDQMIQGNDYVDEFSSSLTPLDWSSEDYSATGVASEAGNEFVLRLAFFVGLKVEILEQDVCDAFGLTCNVDVDVDGSDSFTMPFGTNAFFPIPEVDIPIKEFHAGVMSWTIGLKFDPNLGSREITADLLAGGAVSDKEFITYSEPGDTISLGKINACGSGPDNMAHIQLTNFQYHFNQFLIELAAKSVFSIDAIEYLGFKVFDGKSWTASIPIITVDFSPIVGKLDLRVGAHTQCDWDFTCSAVGPDNKLELLIPVVDLTPPTTSLTASGTAGNNDWYVSDVQIGLSVANPPDGCGIDLKQIEYSFDGISWNVYTVPFTLSSEGITTVHYRSIDSVGNVEPAKTQVIKIDKTPPTITGSPTTTPSAYGWYNTHVVVHFDAADAVSGIATVTPDQIFSGEGADQSVTGTAVDMAGLTASFTVTGIHIDKTLPTISIISPETREYENTETFNVIWSAADSLAGMASESGNIDGNAVTNGQLVELLLLAPGPHTLTVEATDKADNTASESLVFTISVDADGLLAALKYMCNLGWIDKHGVCNSLEAKLSAAIDSINRGNLNAAENQLNAFLNDLEAQKDKSINQSAYDVLTGGALYVIDHLE